jgi:uncharacterized membrane protein
MSDESSATEQITGTSRVEAFSDGVMAVIITIMAFDLRAPEGSSFARLAARLPDLLVYILSFAFVGIYWNNHHHLLRATSRISAAVMWANLVLLFSLSLVPVATEWVAREYDHPWPAAVYGTVALCSALSYSLLVRMIVHSNREDSFVVTALGSDVKGMVSIVVYAAAIGFAFLSPAIAYALYGVVAAIWFIPDRRLSGQGRRRATV